ncbi:zinc metalloproteinase nas-8-like [Musca domestica]|uniref:Metalloendopeptidase n=1 Tax=Musca domestica TaxID=7370 RepID=A0ABM3VB05_MUSDO|nr:zinc metalloproteinase nas-8-like [Musca domestica]
MQLAKLIAHLFVYFHSTQSFSIKAPTYFAENNADISNSSAVEVVVNNAITHLQETENQKSSTNPEEIGVHIEGDIVQNTKLFSKNGVVSKTYRWPYGVIPYEIAGSFNQHDLEIIHYAILNFHLKTCVRFIPRRYNETDYILINNEKSGCWSYVGRQGGRQRLNLESPICLINPGTAIHELMHVLGFFHEQNRQERDSFVKILYENIREGLQNNFRRRSRTAAFNVPYDYASIMHYSSTAFSHNGQPTIVAKQPEYNNIMGQRYGLSSLDIVKINRMYNCYGDLRAEEKPTTVAESTPLSILKPE